MADKSIEQLNAAEKVYLSDLFVLQQSGTAKKLTGQVLKNWLLELAQGHGGITSIDLQSTSGLNKVYRITLADDTYFDMTVSDGKGITSVAKTGTSGLVDTYTMKFDAGSDFVFTVKNGEKGDKGDADRLYFKFASQKPTDASHSMGDVPDAWLGFYAGTTAPTGWQDYTWVRVRGDKGDKGDAATLTGHSTTYMVSDSGAIVPSGSWVADVPNVPQGKYLWTRTVLTFNTGNPVTSYSVSRFGIDGSGAVNSVNGKDPDTTGNVRVNAEDITTTAGTSVEAALAQKQEQITASGLLKGTGDGGVANAEAGVDYQAPLLAGVDYQEPITAGAGVRISGSKISTAAAPRNWLDNSDFTNLVAQAGIGGNHGSVAYVADRWKLISGTVTYTAGTGLTLNGTITQMLEKALTGGSCFVGTASGTATIALDGNTITITSSGGVIKWAALYAEKYTETTKPEYQPKGYGAELAECQRYYFPFSSEDPIAIGYGFATNGVLCVAAIPAMRAKASVVISGAIYMRKSGQTLTASSVANYGQSKSSVQLYLVTTGSDVSVNAPYDIYASDNAKLELTADL